MQNILPRKNLTVNIFKNSLSIFGYLIIFILNSCTKTVIEQITSPTVTSTAVSGYVTDNADVAVTGASVQFGNASATTDQQGFFQFTNVGVSPGASFLRADKAGFFSNFKSYNASTQSMPYRMKLVTKTSAGTMNAATGGTVTIAGVSVTLPVSAVVNASNGAAYNGSFTVSLAYINPESADFTKQMPGDLRGIAIDNSLKALTNFGIAAVELTGSVGELLQIAPGKKASLSVTIPASLVATAPASIPLWYFNETTGVWKQEGSSVKTAGNIYRGDVSHFTYWSNNNVVTSLVNFSGTLVDTAGTPLQSATVKVTLAGAVVYTGYCNYTGYFYGNIPANQQLKLQVYDNSVCTDPIFTQDFTTSSSDLPLGTITLPVITHNVPINGNIKNCSNANITNGRISINDGIQYLALPAAANGTFSIGKLACTYPVSLTLIAEDLTTMQQSQPVNITITGPTNTINLPDMIACNPAPEQFFKFVDNGTAFNYIMPNDTIAYRATGTTVTIINAYRVPHIPGAASTINFGYLAPTTTIGTVKTVSALGTPYAPLNSGGTTTGTVTITEFGNIGQFVAGTFSVVKNIGTVHTITGSFRIRRTY